MREAFLSAASKLPMQSPEDLDTALRECFYTLDDAMRKSRQVPSHPGAVATLAVVWGNILGVAGVGDAR